MHHHVRPRLINPPFSDPGLYFDVGRRRGALLFDIGESDGLSRADLGRVSHLFISHTHMDHVIGLDRLVRVLLGKAANLSIFGPEGIIAHVAGRLPAYTWNLVGGTVSGPNILVTEVRPAYHLEQRFDCRRGFLPDRAPKQSPPGDTLMENDAWQVSTAILDHRTPCLGFRLVAADLLNVDLVALIRRGLADGVWVGALKTLATQGQIPAATRVMVMTRSGQQQSMPAADLARALIRRRPGEIYAYITDASYSPENREKIVSLARDADHLFIEAPFLTAQEDHAVAKCHLTARQAGSLAALAGATDFTIFHFSPRYRGREEQLEAEARQAFQDTRPSGARACRKQHPLVTQ